MKKSKQSGSAPAVSAKNGINTEPKNKKTIDGAQDEEDGPKSYWLMKAEPESRMEKGVDVKFSIDDLREANEPEPWDGEIFINYFFLRPFHKPIFLVYYRDCWVFILMRYYYKRRSKPHRYVLTFNSLTQCIIHIEETKKNIP